MENQTYTLRLRHIFCYVNEEVAEDEIFLKYNGKKIWPISKRYEEIKTGEKMEIDISIPNIAHGTEVKIELWEWDLLTFNDLLGSITMKIDAYGGPFLVDMKPSNEQETGKYSIQWEVPRS
jgi:hypothetical protein